MFFGHLMEHAGLGWYLLVERGMHLILCLHWVRLEERRAGHYRSRFAEELKPPGPSSCLHDGRETRRVTEIDRSSTVLALPSINRRRPPSGVILSPLLRTSYPPLNFILGCGILHQTIPLDTILSGILCYLF